MIALLIFLLSIPTPIKSDPIVKFYTVTATVTNVESDFAMSVSTTNPAPELAWDYHTNALFTIYSSRTNNVGWKPIGTTTNFMFKVLGTNDPVIVSITAQSSTNMSGPWQSVSNWSPIILTNPPGNKYFRLRIQ